MIRFVIVVLAGVLLASAALLTAWAHDGEDRQAAWYRSLLAPDGTSCCNRQDCAPVEARLEGGGWQVRLGGAWHKVPEAAVLRRENLDGRPVACILGGAVKCFVPPAGV